jgi:MFS family permease
VARASDSRWLLEICASRLAFTVIFTAYAAAVPLLIPAWGMTAAQAGLVQSAWHAGYLVSLFAIGFLSDRYGAKRIFLATSIGAAASALAFGLLAHDFVSGVLLYGLAGLCSGGSYTPGLTLIAERFPTSRGRAMGFFLAAASLGYGLALVLTGLLTPVIGWRGAFIVNGCAPLLGLVIALVALRDTPNVVHPAPPRAERAHPIREVVGNRPAMLAIWAYTFHSWELLGLKAWLPAFLTASAMVAGAGALQAASLGALLTAVSYLASAAGGVAGGALSDRLGRTSTMLIMTCASIACAFAFGWLLTWPVAVLVALSCLFIFTSIGDSSVYSSAVVELVPARLIGAAYSVRSVLGFGAGVFAPWVLGLVLDAARVNFQSETIAWGLAWSTLGIGALLGPLAILRLRAMPESAAMAGGRR